MNECMCMCMCIGLNATDIEVRLPGAMRSRIIGGVLVLCGWNCLSLIYLPLVVPVLICSADEMFDYHLQRVRNVLKEVPLIDG